MLDAPVFIPRAARNCRLVALTVRRQQRACGRPGRHANTALGVFDGERFGRRAEGALRQRSEGRGYCGHRVVDEARGDLDDMAPDFRRFRVPAQNVEKQLRAQWRRRS